MELRIMEPNRIFPAGYLEINDARILWPNFSGTPDRFNREGDRNFNLVIPNQEICEMLQDHKNKYGDSWNVKIKPPREEGEVPFMHMPVKVKYKDGRGPNVYLVSGDKQIQLTEDTIGCLDEIDIMSCDMDIRPYDGEMANGMTFRSAYLSAMRVYQRVDRFASESDYMD